MTSGEWSSVELGPYVEAEERAGIDALGERLTASRRLPTPALRAEMRARYAPPDDAPVPWRPGRLRVHVAAYAGSGLVLLALAAVGLAGVGPLGD